MCVTWNSSKHKSHASFIISAATCSTKSSAVLSVFELLPKVRKHLWRVKMQVVFTQGKHIISHIIRSYLSKSVGYVSLQNCWKLERLENNIAKPIKPWKLNPQDLPKQNIDKELLSLPKHRIGTESMSPKHWTAISSQDTLLLLVQAWVHINHPFMEVDALPESPHLPTTETSGRRLCSASGGLVHKAYIANCHFFQVLPTNNTSFTFFCQIASIIACCFIVTVSQSSIGFTIVSINKTQASCSAPWPCHRTCSS